MDSIEELPKRIIKFRCWNPRHNSFNYWGFIDGYFIGPPTGSGLTIEACSKSDRLTGMLDRSGEDIYEGDIVKFIDGETTSTEAGMECDEFEALGEVVWCDIDHRWDISNRHDVSIEDVFNDGLEIVGNIYQNKDLL